MELDIPELITLCRDIVRIQSFSGHEGEAVQCIRGWMESVGFDEIRLDEYGSLIGKISGKGNGKTILFDGHVDTVTAEDRQNWTRDPFGAEMENGRIYGRGTSDMKGALSAMLYAASCLRHDRPEGDVYVSASVFEEKFEGLALRSILKELPVDYVIIGEATNLDLKTGQKGRAEIKIRTLGKSGHAAHPEDAVNAVYKMHSVIRAFREMKLPNDTHLGPGIMELTDILSSPYPGTSVIPSECLATYDRRLVAGETPDTVLAELQAIIAELGKDDPDLRAEVNIVEAQDECYTGKQFSALRFFPAWYFEKDLPFVASALKALHDAGIPAELDTYGFCTNGSISAGELGIPTLGFGPSQENQAHVADEYIEIEQLEQAARGYIALAKELSGNS